MPPTSRGCLLLRILYKSPPIILRRSHPYQLRNASKATLKLPEILRPAPKPSSRPHIEESTNPFPQKTSPPPPPPRPSNFRGWARNLLTRLRANTTLRILGLVLAWVPIMTVIMHHFPTRHLTIEGPSMQPTFNPSYSDELGMLNTKTHVLMLKQSFTVAGTSPSDRIAAFFGRRVRRSYNFPQRGQIVVFRTPSDPEKKSVKRVVGIPGDRVIPLPGYPGGEEPIIIPYNHLWLEGDGTDTLDSNTFGPVSASLVSGTVLCTLPTFQPINWQTATYPAQSRVTPSAVATAHPDEIDRKAPFIDGRAAAELAVATRYPLERPLTKMERRQWNEVLKRAQAEKDRKDPETYALADELETALRRVLEGKLETRTLRNIQMTREEADAFAKDGIVPDRLRKSIETGATELDGV